MKRLFVRSAWPLTGVGLAALVLTVFQNCGQPGSIKASPKEGFDYDDNGVLVEKQYSEKYLSANEAPPLKLVFVMDNSNSMALNNLNLQQSISSMFDSQASNLSQFNGEMYFLTTAQLPSMAGSFTSKIRSPASLTGSQSQVTSNYRTPFTGLISGDLLGFDIKTTTTEESVLKEFKAQPVVRFQDGLTGLEAVPSVKYTKGSSLDALKAEVSSRLNVLSPAKASEITDASVFPALDTESGLCAIGRILRFPDQYIQPGDVTSFIIVSDENEADPSGSKCLATQKREYLYKVACTKRTPASLKKETKIKYQTKPGLSTKQTVFTITPPDLVKPKITTKLTLNRAAKNATCSGTQDREFTVTYQIVKKSYVIKYSKQPKVGEREGGVPIYGTLQSNLSTPNQSGEVPPDCLTNIARLQGVLSDSTSKLLIQGCSQNTDSNIDQTPVNLAYANYPSISFTTSIACPASIIAAVNSGGANTVVNCSLSRKSESISASALSSKGFTSSSSMSDCQTAVTTVCSASSGALRNCTYTGFNAQVLADTRGPVSITQNTALSCSATCATFPGLCATDSTQSVSAFASANGYTCSPSTAASTETYTQAQGSRSLPITGTFSCSNKCSEAPGACSGTINDKIISEYNKSCYSVVQDVAGASSQDRQLATVLDQDSIIGCDTLCSNSNGACTGTITIAQHIESKLMGQSCNVERVTTNIPEQTTSKDLTRIRKSDLNTVMCDTGFTKEGATLTNDFEDSSQNVSAGESLQSYIINRLKAVVGSHAATLSAFITPNVANVAGSATSYGQSYEQLVNSWGQGSVNDIRSPSYAPALTQLSQVLRNQLLRSITFSEVKNPQRIRAVWKRAKNVSDWGSPLPESQWSASGGTVTLAAAVVLDVDDQLKIEFY